MNDDYEHTPFDGHIHEFEWEEDLPDPGVNGFVTVICKHCGLLSVQEVGE